MTALALTLVASIVLLTLDGLLPFPSPGERIVYDPTDWSMLFGGDTRGDHVPQAGPSFEGGAVGGYSVTQPPLAVVLYTVKPGDTITGIAQKLGMNPDTISSMNRTDGRGVHNLTVGEQIRVPSQDGIFVTLAADFDELCAKKNVSPEDVLAANAVARSAIAPGMKLFLPGVQHQGYEYSLSLGVAVLNPLRAGWESSSFGYRNDPFSGARRRHHGIDIAAAAGTTVRSASDGVVRFAGWDDVLGNCIKVRGPLGNTFIYGHMSRMFVSYGRSVSQGQAIGAVGSTGYATGPHLHFEVHDRNGVAQNPALFVNGLR